MMSNEQPPRDRKMTAPESLARVRQLIERAKQQPGYLLSIKLRKMHMDALRQEAETVPW